MKTFKVDMVYSRTVTFYVRAHSVNHLHKYMQCHPEWQPGDETCLIDTVSEERETGYDVSDAEDVLTSFEIDETGELVERE